MKNLRHCDRCVGIWCHCANSWLIYVESLYFKGAEYYFPFNKHMETDSYKGPRTETLEETGQTDTYREKNRDKQDLFNTK